MSRRFKRRTFSKFIYFLIFIIALYSISIGYGLLRQDLDVTGTATITYTGGGGGSIPDEWDEEKVYGKTFDDGTVPIPAEFYYVTGDLSTGVVISDSASDENNSSGTSGNQFVWIPVNMSDFTTTDWEDNAPTGSLDSQYSEPSSSNAYPRRSYRL